MYEPLVYVVVSQNVLVIHKYLMTVDLWWWSGGRKDFHKHWQIEKQTNRQKTQENCVFAKIQTITVFTARTKINSAACRKFWCFEDSSLYIWSQGLDPIADIVNHESIHQLQERLERLSALFVKQRVSLFPQMTPRSMSGAILLRQFCSERRQKPAMAVRWNGMKPCI